METIKKKGGRPKGSKTRPDAPSKLKKLQKLHAVRDAKGHFIPAHPVNPVNPVSKPATPTPPAPVAGESRPDTDLFGAVPDFDRPPVLPGSPTGDPGAETDPGAGADPGPSADPGPRAEPQPSATPESQRPLAETAFQIVINFLAAFMGNWWHPRKVGNDLQNGEIPYDEKELVVSALCEYFHEIGVAIATPLQKLWLAILTYVMPRFALIALWLKEQFAKRKKARADAGAKNDPRVAQTEQTQNPPTPGKSANPVDSV